MAAEVEEELLVAVARSAIALDRAPSSPRSSCVDAVRDALELGDELAQPLARRACRAARRAAAPSRYIAATWAMNVFVAATPISRPARVYSTPSASRVACEPMMLVSASTVAPRSRARRMAASVSAVSPDWVMPIDEVARADHRVAVAVLGGDVHLDRDARPLLDRVAADQARRGSEVPQATTTIRLHVAQDASSLAELVEVDAVGADGAVGDRLGDGVGLLVDLLEHERLVAALLGGLLVPVDLLDRALDRAAVGASRTRRRRRGRRRSRRSRCTARGACGRGRRGCAEPRNCSPSPRPTISGHSLRAPTRTPGSVGRHGDERVVARAAGCRRRARPR